MLTFQLSTNPQRNNTQVVGVYNNGVLLAQITIPETEEPCLRIMSKAFHNRAPIPITRQPLSIEVSLAEQQTDESYLADFRELNPNSDMELTFSNGRKATAIFGGMQHLRGVVRIEVYGVQFVDEEDQKPKSLIIT